MPLPPLLLAVLLTAATVIPAAGATPTQAPQADESSLPPLLVRWPLSARERVAAPQPVPGLPPSLEARVEAPPAALPAPVEPAPVEAAPVGVGERPRPPSGDPSPPGPSASGAIPEREAPSASPESLATPLEPGRKRSPELRAGEPPSQKQPSLPSSGRSGSRDTQFDLGSPLVPPARLALSLGSFEVQPPTEELRRWTFPEQSGLSWSALESAREGDWVMLSGAVDVRVGADRIQADLVRLNEKTERLEAEGNVVLDHLDSRLAGERMEYDLATNKGTVWNAIGFAPNDITFTGERVEKVGDNKYIVYSGSFTSCSQPLPVWQVKVNKAIVDVDNFVYLFNPRVLFKKVPASWLPWAAIPIKQERSTGFMIPKMSSSSTRGFSVSEEFFWAINRSTDLTIGGQWWDKYGWAASLDGRWHLNGMSRPGQFEAVYLSSKEPEEVNGRLLDSTRWYASFEHDQDLWDDWKLTVKGEIGSDRLTQQQAFFDSEGKLGTPSPIFNQRVTLQRRWGKHSLAINLENDERASEAAASASTLDSGSIQTTNRETRRLPEAEYRMSSLQIGGKTWAALQMEASLGYFEAAEPVDYEGTWTDPGPPRGMPLPAEFTGTKYEHDWYAVDVYPQLRFPMGTSFLDVVPSLNLRATLWSRQETGVTVPEVFSDPDLPQANATLTTTPGEDEQLFLWAWDTGVRVGGPDFQRLYRKAAQQGQKKWQHLIEPEVDFRYTPTIDDANLITQDRRRSHYVGRFDRTGATATVNLVNTLRNKTVVPVGEQSPPARDWMIWRLSSDYNFRDKSQSQALPDGMGGTRTEDSHWADIRSDINLRPTENIRFSLRNTYDILQDDFVSTSLTGGVEGTWGYTGLAFTSQRDSASLESTNTELTLTGEHWFYKDDRIRLGYDVTKSLDGSVPATPTQRARSSWPYKRFVVSYYNQCCGVSLSWQEVDDRSVANEEQWTFIVSLKDVGNFLRLRQRSESE